MEGITLRSMIDDFEAGLSAPDARAAAPGAAGPLASGEEGA